MIKWEDILHRIRGVRDRQLDMYGIMRHCVVGAQNEYNNFQRFLKWLKDKEDWLNLVSDKNELPELPESLSPYYIKYKKFLREHDNEYECLSLLRKSVDNAEKELSKWVEEACKQYKGLNGKIICLEDYQQHGTQWIINEYLITDLYKRFSYYDEDNENCYINKLGYGLMASYLTGKDLIKEHWQRAPFTKDIINEIYESVLEDIEKYNLRIV